MEKINNVKVKHTGLFGLGSNIHHVNCYTKDGGKIRINSNDTHGNKKLNEIISKAMSQKEWTKAIP